MESRNINLDIMRIFAAFLVLSIHISGFDFGAKGVQLFFVLCGYLAFESLSKNGSCKIYYKKRLQRILPTYYVCLLLLYMEDIVLSIYTSPISDIFKGQCGYRFLRYVFFLQTFSPTDNWHLWNNHNALWTMSCFAGFYILAPILYKTLNKFYKAFSVTMILILANPFVISKMQTLLSFYPEDAHIEYFSSMNPLTNLYCFMLGITLFMAIKEEKEYFYILMIGIFMCVTRFSWYQYEFLFVILILVAVKFTPVSKKLSYVNL